MKRISKLPKQFMKELLSKDAIFWDFDGVILDSMDVREEGFRIVLSEYPLEEIEDMLIFHRKNGGLSRYVKFRYFFESIRGEPVSEDKLQLLFANFTEVMRKSLVSQERLIPEVLNFISKEYHNIRMHIVSGSDGDELRYLCRNLGISKFFKTIEGSPRAKEELVKDLLDEESYVPSQVCLVGDSHNDYEAARHNGIFFYGFNNTELKRAGLNYLKFY